MESNIPALQPRALMLVPCRLCGDLDDDIGDGLTGGSNMEEVEASRESSGSVGGAGGRDLRLERGMLG